MPFIIVKKGNKYIVKTKGTGKVHGTHDSKESAMKQMRALYANVPEARE